MAENKNVSNEHMETSGLDFIRKIVVEDKKTAKHDGRLMTRFPPEPNGYLHIGHAKSICLNFGIARDYQGLCNLRFDDTNPVKEDTEYVDSIMADVHWLGFDWEKRLYFASDYFEKLYQYAVDLIKHGSAYVCELSAEEVRTYRGTLTKAGNNSPYRERSVDENLDLFTRMRAGEFPDGSLTLRAKIDMSAPNMNMRDPAIYRIRRFHHHRTGDTWCIYPMYDFAHGLSDAIEGITHSLCTLEFEDHRPLYNWFLDQLETPSRPRQIEFARLNLSYMVMSKRILLTLVTKGYVNGWDDPRMPTIAGLRRRGFTPASIRDFANRIGVAKADSTVDIALLYHCLREDLNTKAKRVMVVLDPIKLTISNYPDEQVEMLTAVNNPEDETAGNREIPFSKTLYIERDDFMENAPRKFFRMSVGKEVRLKHAYYVTCTDAIKDAEGNITELIATYDPASKGGWSDDGRKVKGTLHWVSVPHAIDAEVRFYDHLFNAEVPGEKSGDIFTDINHDSLSVKQCKAEPCLAELAPGDNLQFLRKGYFNADPVDYSTEKPVFNQTVALRDSFAKAMKK